MLANKHVLTIDDAPTIRAFMRKLLEAEGAIVAEAGSGEEAIARVYARAPAQKKSGRILSRIQSEKSQDAEQAETGFDLILLDLLLPDMDGIHVLKRIREINDSMTVVVLTGAGGIKSATAAVRLGADGYIEKQDLVGEDDFAEFFYALEQAMDHRAGIVTKIELEHLRSDFYSVVAHDIRSPAGTVSMLIELFLQGQMGELTPAQREYLVMMKGCVANLLRLANDYLDYKMINEGYLKLDLRDCELRDLAEKSVSLLKAQALAKKQTLTVNLPPDPVIAHVDGERLMQVLDNLVSNAIKYTPEEGHITFEFLVAGADAIFRISDTGRGIPPAQIPALFTKFHRLPGQKQSAIRGTGLGLLIVKEIVEAHGGTVRAESEGTLGKGSTFTVTIPLRHNA